jgi:mono/diheme cytochrome c family protein
MKPQEPIPHNYSMGKLHLIFAIGSLVLLFSTLAMVGYDYIRGWKWFQLQFLQIERDRINAELTAAKTSANKEELTRIDQDIRKQEIEIAKERNEYVLLQKELDKQEGEHYAADEDYRFAKAELDAKRYELEVAITQKRADLPETRKNYQAFADRVQKLQLRLQDVTRHRDTAKAVVDAKLKAIKDLEDRKKELTAAVDLLNKQYAAVAANPAFFTLNSPMLDFVSPTLKVDQVVLPDLLVNVNYMNIPRVDRCMTCHRAIDRPGFESKKEAARLQAELQQKLDNVEVSGDKIDELKQRIAQLKRIKNAPADTPNPFRTHPRLETFVGSSSPHPLLEYGCTSCHRGVDRATEFGRAGHTPMSVKQERRWEKPWPNMLAPWKWTSDDNMHSRNWGFELNEFNETPMYPKQYFEAGCLKCHANQIAVNRGDNITKATAMVELYGCYACHKIDNWRFSKLRRPGPDLNGIAEKTTPAWTARWISEPHAFRSTTRMPSFFYQRNMIEDVPDPKERAQNIKYQDVEIQAIVSYLFAKSTHRVWPGPNTGDPIHGKALVESVGCMGCHIAQETVKEENGNVRAARREDFPLERNYGFNLTGVGTKTYPGWVFNWVKNPKNYYPDAPMPDLRLTDAEAADVTAYLMTLQKPGFMQKPLPKVDPAALRELSKGYLINTLTDQDADARLRKMSQQEQLVYLGQRSIEKYGCYSCHNISGFEGLKPIGTELTIEGSKALHLFDFGFVHEYQHESGKHEHVQHNVPSWVYNKVRSPRVYDWQRAKAYNDKLKMPNFHLSESEAQQITTVVLGLTKDMVAQNRIAATDPRSHQSQEALKLISQHNCRACHVVDRYGRAIAATIADANYLPPDLSPEGGRVQSPWLFNFLKDPTVMKIRPWLNVRMPTFHFPDEEATVLVNGFAAKGNVPQFDTTRNMDAPAPNVAIGKTVFAMLRCAQCHQTLPPGVAPPLPAGDTASLAPNLTLSRVRLRHEWIADWIRRPNEMIPGTRMPTNFPRDAATGGFQSPLALAIDTPAFAQQKAAMLPYFKDEAELRRTMADAVALTNYLRDYIWSIGPNEMRTAGGGQQTGPAPVAPPPPPAIPAVKSTEKSAPRAGRAGR